MSPAHAACSASRKTYYQWLAKAEQYGLSALLPKERRTPHQPNAMSMEEVSVILAEAVARPTLGARSLLRHLHARGCTARPREWPGPAPAQLGHCQAARGGLGLLTAADSGQVTDAPRWKAVRVLPVRFSPGQVVSLDTSTSAASRRRRRVATDRGRCRHSDRGGPAHRRRQDRRDRRRVSVSPEEALRHHGITLEGVLTDNGPEFTGRTSLPPGPPWI